MKKRYTITKYIKATGKLLWASATTKEIAKKRFKIVKEAFSKRKHMGLWEVNTHGTDGKVYTRKELVASYLKRLQENEKN